MTASVPSRTALLRLTETLYRALEPRLARELAPRELAGA